MRFLIISVGAAANKCAINLVEKEVVSKEDIMLINSTIKDIPAEYRDLAIRLSDTVQGCGQERSLGKEIAISAINDGRLNLESITTSDYDKVIVISSTCGGTGSGASVIIANYLNKFLNVDVEIIGLVGFEDESARSLRNFIEFCQELKESYTIQFIRNSAFLSSTRGNRTAAELAANDEVAQRIRVMNGSLLKDSIQNIDNTDIAKLNNSVGYKTVEYIEVQEKIKNVDQFNDILKEMLDNSAMIEPDATGVARLGVIMNLQNSSQQFIDRSFNTLKKRLGMPYEVFTHLEYEPSMPEFIAIIASGMKMPAKEIQNIYDKYTELTSAVNKSKDSFFDNMLEYKGDKGDAMFDNAHSVVGSKHSKINADDARKAFLKSLEEES